MKIINYTAEYAATLADLYHRSVHAIDPIVYSDEEKEAWATTPPDYAKWEARLAIKQPYLIMLGDDVAGFIELDDDGHIDCTYTCPNHQGKGVATALYNHIESIAKKRGDKRLYVEASHIAKPFFEKFGFVVLHENKVERNQLVLINFTMEKYL